MVVRALLFCVALMAAAITIAIPATTSRHAEAAEAYSRCWPGAVRQFQLSLPMSSVEAEILAQAPIWSVRPVPEEYGPALKKYLQEHCPPPPVNRSESRAGLALGVLGVGGFVLYWLSPYQQILFRGLRRLHPTPRSGTPRGYRPDLADAVYRQADDAGVTVHGVWLNASDYTKNAVAFGHWRRRHIELASGMEKLLDEDPGTFEVVIRHELGHISHRDLDVTHGVTALWGAFTVLLAIAFCFAVSGYAGNGEYLLQLSFHLCLLAYTLYAARNTFLQSRELHADAFAVSGAPGSGKGEERRQKLDEFFVGLAAQRSPNSGAIRAVVSDTAPAAPDLQERAGTSWPFATHPALQRRRKALQNPALAGELSVWEAGLTGCVALFAVNLLLGGSFDLMLIGLRRGFLELDTLRPLYASLAIPLLLPAGAVLGLGIRHTVVAWGGIRGGRRLAGRLAFLAGGLWTGLCSGCMLFPTQELSSGWSAQLDTMWWHEVTGGPALGLALTAALSILALSLFALVCDTECRPRAASLCVGAYGVLIAVAWFPSALPDGAAPYLQAVVAGAALLSGTALPFLRRRPERPAPVPLSLEEPVTRTEAPDATRPQRLLAHAVTVVAAAGAIVVADSRLVDIPDSRLTLVASMGVVCCVTALAGAAAAQHDAEFRRRARFAAVCLTVGAAATVMEFLTSASLGLVPVLLLLGSAGAVMVAGRISAASLYALSHRRSARSSGWAARARRSLDDEASR
ncbi:M48 family metalloprotease [Streptomyces sp. NPDC002659]|uniref:M48 family metalloprotease n=1 Tax=Streptomyces sp. NPDC002659 TaxID=3364656 RepID=UPI003698AC5B